MFNHLSQYDNFYLNEAYNNVSFKEGAPVLIKGVVLPSGKQMLYVGQIIGMVESKDHIKAKLGGNFYIVKDKGMDGLYASKMPGDLDVLRRVMGMNGYAVGLNYNKTPMWQESIKYTRDNIDKFLNDFEAPIRDLALTLPF